MVCFIRLPTMISHLSKRQRLLIGCQRDDKHLPRAGSVNGDDATETTSF
jgi:Leu/Phe-tRNA-protein transferase